MDCSFVLLERIAYFVNYFMAAQFSRNLLCGCGYICPITFRTGFPLTFKFNILVQFNLGERILECVSPPIVTLSRLT